MFPIQPIEGADHFERTIETEKSLQQVLLIPHAPVSDDHLGNVVDKA